LAESPDANLLQRRARRRLVGAIALVVLVVIALPIVLDNEPSPVGQDLVVQIPSQEAGKFKTPVLPPSTPGSAGPASGPAAAGAQPGAPAPTQADPNKPASGPVAPATEKPSPSAAAPAESQRAPSRDAVVAPRERVQAGKGEPDGARALALLEGKEAWVVPLGAFSSMDNVKQLQEKLAAAGLKSYTESIKTRTGEQTRVRAGPFDSKAAAERARQKLGEMGLKPAAVTVR
jgi:DedD protein